jgi:hypothetical protein
MYIVSMGVPIAVLRGIAAAVAAAAVAVSAWIWVKDLWDWLTGTPPPTDAREKARILVAGPTGVGKTTLIRKIVGAPVHGEFVNYAAIGIWCQTTSGTGPAAT